MAEEFGTTSGGERVERHVLRSAGLEVAVLSYGGVVQSLRVPARNGRWENVSLGFGSVAAYEAGSPYFGALVGRYAGRIAGGRFTLDGREHRLAVNQEPNTLHGGTVGFDRRVWAVEPLGDALRLTLTSPAGDQGFPARVTVSVTYRLVGDDGLRLDYEAMNDEPDDGPATVVDLTNHAYWNLAGEGSGGVGGHELRLLASRYLPIGPGSLPTGAVEPVDGTPMDFRSPVPIGARERAGTEQQVLGQGYDHCWALDGADPGHADGVPVRDGLALAAEVVEPASGRTLAVWTDRPGVVFYAGNHLDGTLVGTGGRAYRQGDAFCLETQRWPDGPNQPHFPSTVLRPGEIDRTSTLWQFGVR